MICIQSISYQLQENESLNDLIHITCNNLKNVVEFINQFNDTFYACILNDKK